MSKHISKKQTQLQQKIADIFTRRKIYKHQRKHNGIPNLDEVHPNYPGRRRRV